MLKRVYAVYDNAAGSYGQPFYCLRDEEAQRNFMSAATSEKSEINQFSNDFSLWALGTFDTDKGQFQNNSAPKMLMTAKTAIKISEDAKQIATRPPEAV